MFEPLTDIPYLSLQSYSSLPCFGPRGLLIWTATLGQVLLPSGSWLGLDNKKHWKEMREEKQVKIFTYMPHLLSPYLTPLHLFPAKTNFGSGCLPLYNLRLFIFNGLLCCLSCCLFRYRGSNNVLLF